jgi:hypothetical protein
VCGERKEKQPAPKKKKYYQKAKSDNPVVVVTVELFFARSFLVLVVGRLVDCRPVNFCLALAHSLSAERTPTGVPSRKKMDFGQLADDRTRFFEKETNYYCSDE